MTEAAHCPECQGDGVLSSGSYYRADHSVGEDERICEFCNGTGSQMTDTPDICERLEPCPFPHAVKRGVFVERDDEDFFFVRVSCGDCGCAGPYVPLDSKDGKAETDDAIERWNTRPQAAHIARLTSALEPFAAFASNYDKGGKSMPLPRADDYRRARAALSEKGGV